MSSTPSNKNAATVREVETFEDVDDTSTRFDREVTHGSLSLRRTLRAPPARVFTVLSELEERSKWFRLPADPGTGHHELDFRVGGGELMYGTSTVSGTPEDILYRSHFLDIVPNERLVLAYDVSVDEQRRWVSLVTIELRPVLGGTSVTYTEQYAFVESPDLQVDIAHLEGSSRLMLNNWTIVAERPADPSV